MWLAATDFYWDRMSCTNHDLDQGLEVEGRRGGILFLLGDDSNQTVDYGAVIIIIIIYTYLVSPDVLLKPGGFYSALQPRAPALKTLFVNLLYVYSQSTEYSI